MTAKQIVTTLVRFAMRCDDCDALGARFPTRNAARAWARVNGWNLDRPDGRIRDRCPSCNPDRLL